mgnify:CR=1 FL=1
MSEKKVLTKEEIQSLKDLKVKFDQLVGVIGETEVQIMNLELRRDALKSNLISIQEEEMKLGKELEEKYGNGTISLEKGEFSPTE